MSLTSCHFCANYSPSDPCSAPLGMQDKRITDAHLTSSSMHDRHHGPWRARLQQRNSGGRGAWSARHNNRKQWIQVNLGTITRVKGVATQGRYEANQWVTSYKVSYSVNGLKFYPYREGRKVKVRTRPELLHLSWYDSVYPFSWLALYILSFFFCVRMWCLLYIPLISRVQGPYGKLWTLRAWAIKGRKEKTRIYTPNS